MTIREVETARRAVAFTFDDGPDPLYTPQILEIFREAGGKATFYMIGSQLEKSPETAAAVRAEGHEIGNHTYSHPHLTRLEPGQVRDELLRTHRLIGELTGEEPRTFRPPYLDADKAVAEAAGELGYRQMIGAVNGEARDWDMPGVEHIAAVSRATVKPGCILLFHDGYGDRSQTVEAVRILAKELREQGYELVTVSELLGEQA
ncbi:polysaccharide deacetylase family protein [Cohnella sp. CBP 2801]|uniref:Polysaccharide deacetylase family protein n=2 Tax=Cohnella zeiphila TaxID=2761120 RepID=A0A7X0SJU7_9BACL|nr:polysaccharide deacetylase family protein [Cohnella zeiphila]